MKVELWILGNHRLLCGDSSKPEDVDRLVNGADIHLCDTDPPAMAHGPAGVVETAATVATR